MSGPVEVFEYLSPKVLGHQWAERTGEGVADEVKVANLLRDDVQAWAGAESLYLWAKDLPNSHILEIQGALRIVAITSEKRWMTIKKSLSTNGH
jgi:hypothetical protein